MADNASWMDAIRGWFKKQSEEMPIGSFMTRITRTPGQVVGELPPGVSAQYNNGSIVMLPNAPSHVIQHESMHALFDRANLKNEQDLIASKITPESRNILMSSPVYQREIKDFGLNNVVADEGTAFDLATPSYYPLGNAEQNLASTLMTLMRNKGKSAEASQLQHLLDFKELTRDKRYSK